MKIAVGAAIALIAAGLIGGAATFEDVETAGENYRAALSARLDAQEKVLDSAQAGELLAKLNEVLSLARGAVDSAHLERERSWRAYSRFQSMLGFGVAVLLILGVIQLIRRWAELRIALHQKV